MLEGRRFNFTEGIDKWYKIGYNYLYKIEEEGFIMKVKGFIYQGLIPVKIDWEDFSENSLRRKDFRKG